VRVGHDESREFVDSAKTIAKVRSLPRSDRCQSEIIPWVVSPPEKSLMILIGPCPCCYRTIPIGVTFCGHCRAQISGREAPTRRIDLFLRDLDGRKLLVLSMLIGVLLLFLGLCFLAILEGVALHVYSQHVAKLFYGLISSLMWLRSLSNKSI
jgi:hypothetical protein